MKLIFNATMKTDFKHDWINSTSVDMYIKPWNYRTKAEDFNGKVLNFTWEVTKFRNFKRKSVPMAQMDVKLAFEYPPEVSPALVQDTIVIFIKE